MSVDIEKVRDFLRSKENDAAMVREELLIQARKDFEEIVSRVITEGNPKEIWQWGSVLRGDFWDYSDIDIAVTGLGYRKFIQLAELCQSITKFPLHMVDLDQLDPVHCQEIKSFGKRIYERSN